MTYSATPLGAQSFKAIRAQLDFATREEPESPAPAKTLVARVSRLALVTAAVGLCGVTLLVCVSAGRPVPPAAPPAPIVPVVQAPLAPAWTEVIRPFQTYDLAGGAFAKLPLSYTARRDEGGTARQDTLAYGDPVPGEPFLRLMFYRRGAEPAPDATIFVDATRLAAAAGLAVTRSGLASTLTTRFGTVEVAGVNVAHVERSVTCLAFRLANPASARVLQMNGLACGTDERPVDLAAVACTVERLDLVSAGDDEDLRAVFVAAERRRGLGCRDERAGGSRPGLADEGRTMRSALKGPL